MNLAQNFQEGNNLTHTWPSCIQPGVRRLALFFFHTERSWRPQNGPCNFQVTAGTDAGEGIWARTSVKSQAEKGGIRPQASQPEPLCPEAAQKSRGISRVIWGRKENDEMKNTWVVGVPEAPPPIFICKESAHTPVTHILYQY